MAGGRVQVQLEILPLFRPARNRALLNCSAAAYLAGIFTENDSPIPEYGLKPNTDESEQSARRSILDRHGNLLAGLGTGQHRVQPDRISDPEPFIMS